MRARDAASIFSWTCVRAAVGATLLVVLALPFVGFRGGEPSSGADASVIPSDTRTSSADGSIAKRQSAEVCKRWAQQSAVINGTLYIYGGRASNEPDQESNTWNNNFLSLDLTESWQISNPSLRSLSRPSGPPAVSLGTLWASYDSLFLYGGQFSDSPVRAPTAFSLWEYDVGESSWTEHRNPRTSAGRNAADSNEPVERSSEGASFSVAGLGRGWYFGGHLDGYTTQGWSQSVERVYLDSMVEYTFPGNTNNALSSDDAAGSDGAWRNITEATGNAGFPERADGILAWIPGFSRQGILVGLAGGTSRRFTQMNVIDVFDVASSAWYKQSTSGPTPRTRVNPCAVVAAAADGSSYQIYMYGGQNLQPAGNQIQYQDMWILTIPSFTWIGPLDLSGQSEPNARAGHTCNVWDAQMVVVGGYVGEELGCDSPGVYSFDLSSLEWTQGFKATSTPDDNPFSRQSSQTDAQGPNAVDGSYGYEVPQRVRSVVGGGPTGGATVTKPVVTATAGPLATGRPQIYTVDGDGNGTADSTGPGTKGRKVAIAVGVVAGVLFLAAIYLAICAVIYRRRLKLYQQHMEAERDARSRGGPDANGAFSYSTTTAERRNKEDTDGPKNNTARFSDQDLLGNMEPTFVGIMLHPKRSLRVVNK
ncbi:MAG: hypothetical protein M1831_001970 [Alyxoria varia]|nr:MAG: hypothetical protein M1831_001970 [Alyxoria varia]